MAIGTGTAILGAAALGAGAGLYGSSRAAKTQANAARDAAAAQVQAADRAAEVQREMFERQVELQEPFRQGGLTAQNRLMALLGLAGEPTAPGYGRYARDFSMADYEADPGYGFRMSEGMKALERSAAARGGLLSGTTLKGVQRFGQDLASQEYQNAFNRYQINRAAQLNPLQSLMGAGQTSANALTNAAGDVGRGLAGTYMGAGAAQAAGLAGAGQARASGYVGATNALTGALSQAVPNYMMYNYLNPSGGGGGYAAPGLSPMMSGFGYT
jgi:hypothetical protein